MRHGVRGDIARFVYSMLKTTQVYGAVTMNNTLCLGVFLLVIYLQDLSWTYTAEVGTRGWKDGGVDMLLAISVCSPVEAVNSACASASDM